MYRLIALLLFLTAPAFAGPSVIADGRNPKVQYLFETACELSGIDCTDIAPPVLIVMDTEPVLGFHIMGTNIVFLTDNCMRSMADLDKCSQVAIHEIVHYLRSETLASDNKCDSEAAAWEVSNKYARAIGRENLVVEDWVLRYPSCVKSLNSSTSSVTQ